MEMSRPEDKTESMTSLCNQPSHIKNAVGPVHRYNHEDLMSIRSVVMANINLRRLYPETVKNVRRCKINKRGRRGGKNKSYHQKGVNITNIIVMICKRSYG